MILLHLSGSVLAYYRMALENQWRMDSEKYGACIRDKASVLVIDCKL